MRVARTSKTRTMVRIRARTGHLQAWMTAWWMAWVRWPIGDKMQRAEQQMPLHLHLHLHLHLAANVHLPRLQRTWRSAARLSPSPHRLQLGSKMHQQARKWDQMLRGSLHLSQRRTRPNRLQHIRQ